MSSKFNKNRVLVIGGGGYIGSAVVRWLEDHGMNPLAYDKGGNRHHVSRDRYLLGDLFDRTKLKTALRECDMVVNCAALSLVGEDRKDPGGYWKLNVEGMRVLLRAMAETGVNDLVFASSAAVYGAAKPSPIREDDGVSPINVYGITKAAAEADCEHYCHHHDFNITALRFFNVAGASPCGKYGEERAHETHLIPLALRQFIPNTRPEMFFINGNDYPTPDGTCIRDYVHVNDVADAVEAALESLDGWHVYNVGSGMGHSNLEVMRAVEYVTQKRFNYEVREGRLGDPPALVADIHEISEDLDWEPRYNLEGIIETAWRYVRNL